MTLQVLVAWRKTTSMAELSPMLSSKRALGSTLLGDAVSFFDPVLNTRHRSDLLSHAVESGKLAGFNMAGARKPYLTLPSFHVTLQYGTELEGIGCCCVGKKGGKSVGKTFGVWEKPVGRLNKGVVYFLDGEAVVRGVLLWNVPGRVDSARRVLWDAKHWCDSDYKKLVQQISLEPLGDPLLEAALK